MLSTPCATGEEKNFRTEGVKLTAIKLAGKYISAVTVRILIVWESRCDLPTMIAMSSFSALAAMASSRIKSLFLFRASVLFIMAFWFL